MSWGYRKYDGIAAPLKKASRASTEALGLHILDLPW
jgi:hypothetical protein